MKNEECMLFVREDQDGSGRTCRQLAVEKVDGTWYCVDHLALAKRFWQRKQQAYSILVPVNEYGEHFRPDASLMGVAPSWDKKLYPGLMVHHLCGGCVDKADVSEEFFALSCRSCRIRVMIPKILKTWEEFKEWKILKIGVASIQA